MVLRHRQHHAEPHRLASSAHRPSASGGAALSRHRPYARQHPAQAAIMIHGAFRRACPTSSFGFCPCAHAVFVGLNFANISPALSMAVPTVTLEVVVAVRCVEPYDGVGRAMPLRRLLVGKSLHPLTQRCTDSRHKCNPWEQPVSDSSHDYFSPINFGREARPAILQITMRHTKSRRLSRTRIRWPNPNARATHHFVLRGRTFYD